MKFSILKSKHRFTDFFLLFLLMVLAGCGLIYEYIFSHYAGRVLGSLETVLFSIIGIMIVSMGIGSFLAARIKDAFVAVSILESLIAITAIAGIYIISGTYSLAFELPKIIADTYQLSQTNPPRGYLVHYAENILEGSAYIMAAIIGVLIGMEIPLVARIRQSFHQQHLEHNTGTVYGVDYIGAGLGAFLWVIVMIKQEISTSIAIVASINIVAGYGFIMVFSRYIKRLKLVITVQVVSTFIVYFGASNIGEWQSALEQSLYAKPIVVSKNTDHQRLVITEGRQPYTGEVTYDLYLNGQIQFSQQDEHIYHSLLVYPPMLLVNNPKNVLIIGGGDGLALRDVLKFPVDKVTLVDFDKGLVSYFKEVGVVESDTFLALNEYAFSDPRVQLVIDDAFSTVHKLMAAGKLFDAIIIDLPDPSHPDLNKLYSKQFFKAIKNILNSEGAFSIQSTSPYYAKPAFLSIKKTIEAAGFETVEQYQQNVPSFGQWGWSVATKKPTAILDRFEEIDMFPVPNKWLTPKLMRASFEFPKDFYSGNENIKINEIGSGIIYQYYQEAWVEQTRYYLF